MSFAGQGETNVNINTDGEQFAPQIVWLANGGYLVAWRDPNDGEIKGRIFTATGGLTGPEFTLATTIDASGQGPALTATITGGFAIAWTQDATSGLFVQAFRADGTPDSAVINVTTNTVTAAFGLTESASGELLVAYSDIGAGGSIEQVALARVITTLGSETVTSTGVNGSTGTGFGAVSVDELANGDTVVAYIREEFDAANGVFDFSVFARVIDAAGAFANAEILLGALPTTDFGISSTVRPIVKALPNGNFAVVWVDELVNVAVIDAATGTLVQPVATFQGAGGSQNLASLDVAASGEFVVAWTTPSTGLDGDGFGIQAQRFDQSGAAIGTTFFANSDGFGDQAQPAVALQPNGDFAIVWTDLDSVRSGVTSEDIELQAFQAAPPPPPPPGVLDLSSGPSGLRFDFDQDGTAAGNTTAGSVDLQFTGFGGRLQVNDLTTGASLLFEPIAGSGIAENDIVEVIGTTGSDVFTLAGTDPTRSLTINGGGGADGDSFLISGAGSHILRGGDGEDGVVIGAFTGRLTIDGGAQQQFRSDSINFNASSLSSGVNFTLTSGPDADGFWSGSVTGSGRNATISLKGVESLFFGDQDDTVTLTGAYANSVGGALRLEVGLGANTVAIAGADRVSIFSGATSNTALNGGDTITVTGGTAFVSANGGDDTIDLGEGGASATDGDIVSYGTIYAETALNPTGVTVDLADTDAQGFATARIAYANGRVEQDRVRNVETVWGAALGNDVLRAANNTVPFGATIPELQGFGGNDLLIGRAGTNLLAGGGGNDRLEGGDGNDTLLGGRDSFGLRDSAVQSDDDLLIGGRGDDLIYGDTFATFDRVGLVDADIAQYAGNRADYDVLAITDSSGIAGFQITHARNTTASVNDGVDRVFQVETFRFADGDVPAAALLAPPPPVFTLRAPASPDRRVLVEEDGPAPGRTFEIEVSRSVASVLDAATVVLSLVGVSANPASASDVVDGFANRTVEFAAGETRKVITISVADDALFEPVEQFEVRIASTTLGTSDPTAILVSITSDDGAPPPPPPPVFTLSLAETDAAVEGTPPGNGGLIAFRITRDPTSDLGAATVTVAIAGAGPNAASADDLVGGFATRQVVFANGERDAFLTLATAPDAVFEGNETFSVTLVGATLGTVNPAGVVAQILNDDAPPPPPPVFRINLPETDFATEGTPPGGGGALTLRVSRDPASDLSAATVTVSIAGIGANPASADDIVGGFANRDITFAQGETEVVFNIAAIPDAAFEPDEQIVVALVGSTIGTVDPAGVTPRILNDDAPPPSFALRVNENVEREGGGIAFLIERVSGSAAAATITVSVGAGATGSPASSGDVTGGFRTFTIDVPAGADFATFAISSVADTIFEPDETISVALVSSNVGTVNTAPVTAVIFNDDAPPPPPPVFRINLPESDFATEGTPPGGGGALTLRVSRDPASDLSAATVTVSIAGIGANPASADDIVGGFANRDITFAQGETEVVFNIAAIPDPAFEPNEQIVVALVGSTIGTVDPAGVTPRILNDDAPPPPPPVFRINLPESDFATEGTPPGGGGALTLRVSRDPASDLSAATVTVSIAGIGANPASADDIVGGFANRDITFAQGETEVVFNIAAIPDAAFEPNEQIVVALVGSTIGTVDPAGVTPRILNDDALSNFAPSVSGPVEGVAVEDGAIVSLNALANAFDIDSPVLQVIDVPGSLPAGVTYDASRNAFTLNPANLAYQSLAAGVTTFVSVDYKVSDGSLSTPGSVRWIVVGTNDPAVITGATTGTVIEDAPSNFVTGQLTAADVDGPSGFTAQQIATLSGYGTASITAAGLWTYTLNNASPAVNALNAGQTLADSFVVSAADGTTQTINVTIQGATDAAGLNPINPPNGADVVGTGGGDLITINASNTFVEARGGADTVRLASPNGFHFLDGGAGTDTIDFSALATGVVVDLAIDLAFYGQRAAVVRSFENAITGAGADTLRGSNGANVLSAGAGNDVLEGRGGGDVLTGGDGGDRFVFSAGDFGSARATITDFEQGLDRIDFRGVDANLIVGGNQSFSGAISFWNGQGSPFPVNAPGFIAYSYEVINGVQSTVISLNNDRDAAADLQIVLTGVYTPTGADILL